MLIIVSVITEITTKQYPRRRLKLHVAQKTLSHLFIADMQYIAKSICDSDPKIRSVRDRLQRRILDGKCSDGSFNMLHRTMTLKLAEAREFIE